MKPLNYFQGVLVELKKVNWPTFPALIRYFFSVLLGIAAATALVGSLDYIFIKLLGFIIK